MKILSPKPNEIFTIASDATAPVIDVYTDAQGSVQWSWTVHWRTFSNSGTGDTNGNWVRLQPQLADLGGTLTITARAGGHSASVTVGILGTNPSLAELRDFTRPLPQGPDLLLILEHETHGRNFNTGKVNHGQPIVSFDNGYGMAQLTTPRPKFEQCWSWKENVRGGISLFAQKRAPAIRHLSKEGRTYTPDQLRRETIALWNGSHYHEWNGTAWERPTNILCAPGTGNIGWDISLKANENKTVSELQKRDSADYRKPRNKGDNWAYFGVCYVDSLLGS